MADIIDFKSRVVKEDPRPDLLRRDGVLVLACVCGSTLSELHSDGVVFCARCKSPAYNIRWEYKDPPAPEGGKCA